MTKIVRCKVEKILGVNSVEFAPNGESVTIGGRNGQGKSSAIRALAMALGGKRQVPEKPVHGDERHGFVTIELDQFIIECRIDSDRELKLIAKTRDGVRLHSAKQMLDTVFEGLSFDPGEFKSFDRDKRAKTLLELAKLDFTELDNRHKGLYEERTQLGREVTNIQGRLSAMKVIEEAPAEEVSVAAIMERLGVVRERIFEGDKLAANITDIEASLTNFDERRTAYEEKIKSLRIELATTEHALEALNANCDKLLTGLSSMKSDLASMGREDLIVTEQALLTEAGQSEQINRCVRHNKAVNEVRAELQAKTDEVTRITNEIAAIKAEREKRLREAKFPIDGLSFIDGDVTFNGVPFAQIAESEQWEISTAISFALNPKGIVFISQSGGLDRMSRDRVRARAAELGIQLFMEVVDDADDVQILIEGGEVKEDRIAPVDDVVTT